MIDLIGKVKDNKHMKKNEPIVLEIQNVTLGTSIPEIGGSNGKISS